MRDTTRSRRTLLLVMAMLAGALALGPPAWAQQASSIAGVVRDSEGLPMPGVTIEAASPALIQQSVTVFSDGEGRYTIVDLRPGTYSVTFSLPGFSTLRRDGIELTSGFTATVNVAMAVGSLQETITVTGAAPVVDTQTIRQQETLTTTDLTSLPTGNIGLQTLAYVTPGFATTTADVGGTRDTWSAQGAYTNFHGKAGTRASFDGFRNQYFVGGATGVGYITDQGITEELQLETSGMGAETGGGTTNLNMIPKSGSNTLRASLEGFFSNGAMQGSNLDADLAALGVTSPREVGRIYRVGGQLGGPFVRDRLWFFAAIGRWGARNYVAGGFFNPLQGQSGNPVTGTLFYPGQPGTPFANQKHADFDARRAAQFDWNRTHSLRTTWQVTQSQRVSTFVDIQKSCRCTTGYTGANAIEADVGWDWYPSSAVQGTWTMPLTSRLLMEAGASWHVANWVNFTHAGVTRDDRSILERSTNYRYGSPGTRTSPKARTGRSTERFSVSYVTGSHNFKAGVSWEQGFNDQSRERNHPDELDYDFLNGRPDRIQIAVLPLFQQERMHEVGVFAQDSWTISRVTLTGGVRFDYVNGYYPEADLPAGRFVPARHVDAQSGIPEWTDVSPRFGVALDVFGNGRTAVRGSVGRYVSLTGSGLTTQSHPFSRSVTSAFRTWNDLAFPVGDPRRGNYIPDCDLTNLQPNQECGVISNQFFGTFNPSATLIDDSVLKENRFYTWDINLEVQHEVTRGLSVSFGYNRNWDGNFTATENTFHSPSDFDEFCITAPVDSRLPNGGGYEQCGFYEVSAAKFSQRQNRITQSSEFGERERYWNGFVASANGRLPHGITIGGGIDVGRNVADECFAIDSPADPFCRVVTDYKNTLDFRLRGSVPLPAGINASFIYRNTAGAVQNATLTVSSAQVRFVNPGRTTLNTSQSVNLYVPNSIYGERFSQLDFSLNKRLNLGFGQLRVALDLYNALNSNSVQTVRSAYSRSVATPWLQPTQFLDPRLVRVTAGFEF